eukprot:1347146-Rhodomonas_salina.2
MSGTNLAYDGNTCLRAPYAMSGTDIAYGCPRACTVLMWCVVFVFAYALLCAMSGTDRARVLRIRSTPDGPCAYRPTHPLCDVRY